MTYFKRTMFVRNICITFILPWQQSIQDLKEQLTREQMVTASNNGAVPTKRKNSKPKSTQKKSKDGKVHPTAGKDGSKVAYVSGMLV